MHECIQKDEIKSLFERCRKVDSHEEQIKNLQTGYLDLIAKIDKLEIKIDNLITRLSNRLPAWATVIFAILTSVISGLAVYNLTPKP